MKRMIFVCRLLPLCLLAACSSRGNGDGGDAGPPAPGDSATPAPGRVSGAFRITLVEPTSDAPGRTTVLGKVNDGPAPTLIVWEQATTDGPCQLLKPRVPRCDPPCTGGAVCVEDDTCQGYPSALSVGQVRVEGLITTSGAAKLDMEPIANNYQPPGSVTLAYPGCTEGEPVNLNAGGDGPIPAFGLTAKGISPLELLSTDIELADGQAATLSWTPGQEASARIKVQLDISHHGGTKGKIVCDTDDSGSLELSVSLLDQLRALGVSGFPTVIITRESVGSAKVGQGEVSLSIASPVEREVKIPGVVSCNDDEDCTEPGQTCQVDRRCQR